MRASPVLTLLGAAVALLSAGPAKAGFFERGDRYEPPSPRFLTPWVRGGLMLGGWQNDSLLDVPLKGLAVDGIVSAEVMLMPMTKVGLRLGGSRFGGSAENDGRTIELGQYAAWSDAVVQLETDPLCLYAGTTLLGGGMVSAPGGRQPAGYEHLAIGATVRSLKRARPGFMANAVGLTMEARRTRMTVDGPTGAVPPDVSGWTVVGSATFDWFGNARKERK